VQDRANRAPHLTLDVEPHDYGRCVRLRARCRAMSIIEDGAADVHPHRNACDVRVGVQR
jgi:hypothetical protein